MQQEIIPFVPQCPICEAHLPYVEAPHSEHPDCPKHLGSVPKDPVEWTVYSQYAQYPTLFGRSPWSRWFIFDHLFFTLGGGYEWIKGELRDVTDQEFVVGSPVPFRTWEEEERDILGEILTYTGKMAARLREMEEEFRQQQRERLRADWAKFDKKPQKWYPLSEYSNIFSVPIATVTHSWLLAAIDATQMFLQGNSDGQSLLWIYRLIKQRETLFASQDIPVPEPEENKMAVMYIQNN